MTRRHALFGVATLMALSFTLGAAYAAVVRLGNKTYPKAVSTSESFPVLQSDTKSSDAKQFVSVNKPVAADELIFKQKIQPFLENYCNSCHNSEKQKGGVTLDQYSSEAQARKDRVLWESVGRVVATGEMPPKKSKQPDKDAREYFQNWVENSLTKVECGLQKDPGRVTLRRLNRAEYNNTIRDLCGVDFKPADDFPSDDVGYGFDNIGDVLSMPPILLEKYLFAADKIIAETVTGLASIKPSKQSFRPQTIQVIPKSSRTRETNDKGKSIVKIVLNEEGSLFLDKFNFPADGEYIVRLKAWGKPEKGEAPKLSLRIEGKEFETISITESEPGKAKTYETKVKLKSGEKRIAYAFLNPATDTKMRAVGIELLEIEGPIGGGSKTIPDSVKKIFIKLPNDPSNNVASAEVILKEFARRAYRRPVQPDELARLMKLYALAESQGDEFEDAIRLPMKAVLVSPFFLFRAEQDPKAPETVRVINDFEFATRLSYFLWASMPDDELFSIAAQNKLREPATLKAQIKRMLADSRSTSLTENFAGQWLMLRNIRTLTPDPGTYKSWDEPLRGAIIRESELFFEHIVKEDRSILEFLDCDYTFLNDRLSWHYGINGIKGKEFRKVKLTDSRRGGIITQASMLLVTSNPTRTSPVKRGKWILENLLGITPPPPAPDVPELEKVVLKGTLRQQMEQHRANVSCAGCHAKLDPLGFGLENFDGIGKWRDLENEQKIDSSGVLPGGITFNGPSELRKVLLTKSDQFRKCFSEKLLTYALGRGLEYYDRCVLDEMVAKLKAGQDHFSTAVLAVVESDSFQKRRAKRSE